MKKIYWINPIIFTAILLLVACKKEPPSSDTEDKYIHWPVVKTLKATNVDSSAAKLNGTVNGYGLPTTVTFEYGTTTDYGSTVTAFQSLVRGDSITHVSADISGLTAHTIYHYRVKAENSKWINFYGPDSTFMSIPLPPTLMTTPVSGITDSTAISGGNITFSGCPITESGIYWWGGSINAGDHFCFKNDSTGTGSFTSRLTELEGSTTYYVQSFARNCAGIALGNIVSFATAANLGLAPDLRNYGIVVNISTTGATLTGMVNANNLSTTVTFEYGLTTNYGTTTTASQNPVTGDGLKYVSADLSGLVSDTTYHFRINAKSRGGVVHGNDCKFITSATIITTLKVTNITATTAESGGIILDTVGNVTARGIFFAPPGFIYCHCRLPKDTWTTHDGTGTGNFTSKMTDLSPSSTYFVRAYATTSTGRYISGNMISFKTLP
jgi:hypothetical protein